MLLYDVNLNYFRVFMAVYFRRSMTEAAQDLHLTQSGVSQQIKNLEGLLGVQLFDRIHRRLIPRAEADLLYHQCEKNLHELENLLGELRSGQGLQLKGTVRIGMPKEFGVNVIAPLLSEFGQAHPEARFICEFGFPTELGVRLISGELDLAFFDHFKTDPRIVTTPLYREELQLCISPDLKKEMGAFRRQWSYFQKLPYIAYQKDAPVLKMWFAHHLGKRKTELKVRATAMDVSVVAALIRAGLGVGILPNHFIAKAKEDGIEFFRYQIKEKNLLNEISLATLRERHFPPLLVRLIEFFKSELAVH